MADRVITLEPLVDNNYSGKADYVIYLTGDLAEAKRILEQMPLTAEYSDKFNWLNYWFAKKDYDEIIERISEIDSEIPFIVAAREMIIASAKALRDGPEAAKSDLENAKGIIGALLEQAPGNVQIHQWMSGLLGFLGDHDGAIREAKLAVDLSAKDLFDGPSSKENLARVYAWAGRADEALELLEQLLNSDYSGAITVVSIDFDVAWDPIRDDPRFQALIEKHS
jgi:tetratricopeptide (TPR) repeat protein